MRFDTLFACAALVASACSGYGSGGEDVQAPPAATPPDDGGTPPLDAAATDAPAAATTCNPLAPFEAVEAVPDLSAPAANTAGVRLSADELTAFFARMDPNADWQLFMATRLDRSAAFGTAVPLSLLNTGDNEIKPSITADRQRLYFCRFGQTSFGLHVAKRNLSSNAYETPTPLLPPVADGGAGGLGEADPFVSDDGQELFFVASRNGPREVWVARTAVENSDGAQFATVEPVGSISDKNPSNPVLSHDGLTLYFAGPDDRGGSAVWATQRPKVGAAFGAPVQLEGPGLDADAGAQRDEPSWLSPDACTLYFFSNRNGVFSTFRAKRTPK